MTRAALVVFLLGGYAGAAQTPATTPAPVVPPDAPIAEIVLPATTPAPKPPKPPVPPAPAPVNLPAGVYYVVTSTNQFLAAASPDGLVNINRTKGPITLFGRFVDEPDTLQERKFDAPYVTVVTATGTGRCELIIWPVRATEEKQIMRQPLDTSVLPIPPPLPPVLDFQAKLQAAFAADAANDKVTTADAAKYALFFRRVADKTNKGTIVYDSTLKTWPQVGDAMKAAVALIGLPAGSFQRTARVIADNLNPTFGTVTTLDDAMRDRIAAALVKTADALEALK